MTRIQSIAAFITNDGKFHKTEIDAKIHVAGITAKIAHLKTHLKQLAEYQRSARIAIKVYVAGIRHNGVNRNTQYYISNTQKNIAQRTENIRTIQRQLDDVRNSLRSE